MNYKSKIQVSELQVFYSMGLFFGTEEVVYKWSMGRFHQHFTRNFYEHRSQSAKSTVKTSLFFALLGSAHVKA
jgi:hypothetical protein